MAEVAKLDAAAHPSFDRAFGASKIGIRRYLERLTVMGGGDVSTRTAARFAAVGTVGFCVDYAVFEALIALGLSLLAAQVSSFLCAMIVNYALNSRWTFSHYPARSAEAEWRICGRFVTISLMALFLRAGVLQLALEVWNWPQGAAAFFGIATGALVNYLASAFYVFPAVSQRISPSIRWRIAAVGVALYAVLLRLVYMRTLNLIPEEAYYWNYSQHLDFGYLDHPPMIAWLIWLSTHTFGGSEFAVRASALLTWFVTVAFCFELTRNLYGKTAAFVSILLLSSIPYYFATGFLMMPDAPLLAAWAGVLFFLERVFFGESRTAWLGVGICVGLGLVSKYSIALLGPAIVLFMLIDPKSRYWFGRPWPYAGAALALAIFSPVIAWNATHGWVSFLFQSARRVQEPFQFSLHLLLLSIVAILTPAGLISVWRVLLPEGTSSIRRFLEDGDRRWLFAAIFTVVPLSVFITFSLFHDVKLNWTAPVWLAVLPAMAALVTTESSRGVLRRFDLQRAWSITTVSTLVICGGAFHYIAIGLPGLPSKSGLRLRDLPVAWKELGEKAFEIEKGVRNQADENPLMVGMDRYFMASELAYYDGDHGGSEETAGRSLFGAESLMYKYWFPADKQNGRNMILFGFEQHQLNSADLASHFHELGPIKMEKVTRRGVDAGLFYYRVGYNYRASAASPGQMR
jgi:dolichol-phosphate mannosyltransferase